jgi:Zn-dependent protease
VPSLAVSSLVPLLARAITFLFAIGFHEAAHAWSAYRLGDDTAKRMGRLTLNPIKHLDPLGYILAVFAFIGWGKPTPVSPWRLRYGPRIGGALVAGAGPVTNLLLAVAAAILWRLMNANGCTGGWTAQVLGTFLLVNVALFIFNLVPLAPLDGASVLAGIVGARGAQFLAPLQAYGPMILLGLIMLSYIPGVNVNVFGRVLYPAMSSLAGLLSGSCSLSFG